MKKLNSYVLALMMGGMLFTASCDNEDVNPPAVVAENNVPNGRIKITYSVQVVNPVSATGGKVAGVAGAVVTITSASGKVSSAPVTEDGIATFTNVSPGTVSGFVKVSGYSTVNFTSDLTPTVAAGDSDQVQFAASKVAVYPKSATLQARIYGNFTINPSLPTVEPAGTNLLPADNKVRVIYNTANYDKGTGLGKLTSVSIEPTVVIAYSGDGGVIDIPNLYPTTDGSISANFVMEDYLATKSGDNKNYIFRLDPSTSTTNKVTNIKLYANGITNLGDILSTPAQ
ncbi:hypothetical protein SAMN05421780_102493 [Flexibacter flexilis DSM 6793]|uniref:Carboxypeptidase regulatory-like domain-containing protein n=1 Tax=Flexibacter flexilis DSM 6793 TaxID=927664 RepID=A0A1I1G8H0_9BACT|nr:carboxypeptidase-like regulatory domain-containing protein [Flexibacter flexilis]SFC07874.1 hypothetical protein SAMN05421780_102493 [Flexibacter flexilis DSM 6793]